MLFIIYELCNSNYKFMQSYNKKNVTMQKFKVELAMHILNLAIFSMKMSNLLLNRIYYY